MKIDLDRMLTTGARREKTELIAKLLGEYYGRFRIVGNEGFNELKVRVMVDKIQMNNIKSSENIEAILRLFFDRRSGSSQIFRASRILLDPLMTEEQKMSEINAMMISNG